MCGILFGVPGVLLAVAAIRAIRAARRGLAFAVAGVVLNALWIAATIGFGVLLMVARANFGS